MSWFPKLCRQAGLMIHHATHPAKKQNETVRKTVEEKKVNDQVTLRRTTIEEIEIKKNGNEQDDK
ncbi:hypothetical protein [Poriferisphaera sp. WC338]|uniref:hypothetical protein n=1 Tax=Poriferisphaera sp. WC338 TaxID=3425129 RepID=UPI003D8180C3